MEDLRYYTLEEVSALAVSVAPESTDTERVFMDEWIYHGLRQLGVNKDNIKSCVIEMHDLGIAKPRDYYMARDLALFDGGGGEIDYIFRAGQRRMHTDIRTKPRFIEVSESRDYFHLSSDANDAGVVKAQLEYYALPSTDDGDLYIPENHVFAIMHFVKYMLAFRNGSAKLDTYKKYWEKEASKIRSKNSTPHQLEFKEGLARVYMSMMNKPTRDRF